MKLTPILFTIIFLISGQNMQAKIINDSIPAGKNFERAVFRLWYPDDLKVVHGIIVLVPGSNGDGRGQVNDTLWQAFAERHGFALLGCCYTDYKTSDMFIERYVDVAKGSGQALIDIVKKFSRSSGHPELKTAPFLLWGHSAGGEFNYEFACWNPKRVIAFVVNKGGIYYTALASKETRSVPAILFTGEKDLDARKDIVKGLFSMNRRASALWIYAPEPEAGHEIGQTERLARVFFDEIIPLRISDYKQQNSSQSLKPLNESEGIIGDHKSQTISPVSEGKKYDYPVSWFPGMKTAQAWLAFISSQLNENSRSNYRIPENVKKILFLGNSITYMGQYVSYIEAYLTIHYPEKRFEFINLGLPSETVTGLSEPNHAEGRFPRPDLHERLERVLTQTKPDLVFACYGMNDGIYLPFDEARFQKFKEGINWLHDQVTKTGASIIHVTPPIFDEYKGKAYANVLDIYSDWLISLRYTTKWDIADIHWPMKKYLEERRLVDSTFTLAQDGVHPDDIGHWIIAKQVLLFLGEKSIANVENIKSAMASIPNGQSILELVEERQYIMKDAWLTSTEHTRPEMKTGLPLKEAQKKADEIESQIRKLLR